MSRRRTRILWLVVAEVDSASVVVVRRLVVRDVVLGSQPPKSGGKPGMQSSVVLLDEDELDGADVVRVDV